jgi:hypothetical protein
MYINSNVVQCSFCAVFFYRKACGRFSFFSFPFFGAKCYDRLAFSFSLWRSRAADGAVEVGKKEYLENYCSCFPTDMKSLFFSSLTLNFAGW